MRRAALSLAALGASTAAWPTMAHAKERLVRQLGSELAVPPQSVSKIAQDPTGYLWLGTASGLHRHDGVELRRWAPETIRRGVTSIAIAPDGSVYAAAHNGPIYRVTATGAEPLLGPGGREWEGAARIAVDARGRLWVVAYSGRVFHAGRPARAFAEAHLYRRGFAGNWEQPLEAHRGHERMRIVERDGDGMLVGGFEGVWRFDADDRLESVFALDRATPEPPIDLLRMPDGSLVLATDLRRVLRQRQGRVIEVARIDGRPREIVLRGETLWIASDQGVTALQADGRSEHMNGAGNYAQSATTILVDREGSLWVGGGRGAFQFPEPDTLAWTTADGLGRGSRRLARTPEGLFVGHWGGELALIETAPPERRARLLKHRASVNLCSTERGTLWAAAHTNPAASAPSAQAWIASRAADGVFRWHRPVRAFSCGRARDGGLWLGTAEGLYHVSSEDRLRALGHAHDGSRTLVGSSLVEDAKNTLWMIVAGEPRERLVCRAPAVEVRAGRGPSWACVTLGNIPTVDALTDTPSGALWLATPQPGVMRYDGKTLRRVPGSLDLPSPQVRMLAPARSGDVWVSGAEYLWRVKERTDLPEGWSVEERLGRANGIMADGAFAIAEEDDGSLWLTTAAGVVHVPRSARSPKAAEPRLRLRRVTVNGRPIDPDARVEVPHGKNEVVLEVTALLFRDPANVQYRIRLAPNAAWSTASRLSRIQLVDVPSGSYAVEVSVSVDGVAWTEMSPLLRFHVPTPWHRRPSIWATGALLALAVIASVLRWHLAMSLRLERERTQIALDLHDEMGSGLGSIRVLAGLLSRGGVEPEKRRQAAVRIDRTARDLGQALTGIVWSLRDSGRTLRDLCAHVAERGHELFPDEAPVFETAFPPEWPAGDLRLPLRRGLQLILMEALHNAAKHARAGRVVFGVAAEDAGLRLWVEDDGVGIRAGEAGRGHGLPGMRDRAQRIGVDLDVGRARAHLSGTRIDLLVKTTLLPVRRKSRWAFAVRRMAWPIFR
jgi:signal transduction histidine kinase/ligand-binding sensor domain-containing protein